MTSICQNAATDANSMAVRAGNVRLLSARPKSFRFVVCGALAIALIGGSVATGQFNQAFASAAASQSSRVTGKLDRAVAKAEKGVAKAPANAALRVVLANAYLQAGRFDSAATAFSDAASMGDTSARTALGLALSHIGAGRSRQAVAVLDQSRDTLAASDLGLALALAGETSRGVAVLADALRSGEATVKLRQNLAYAYALDGRWQEAQLMVAQDLPAGQVDERLATWAQQARPDDYQKRVAAMLGAPVRADIGQPAALALIDSPAAAVPAQADAGASGRELAALDGTPGELAAAEPIPQPVAYGAPSDEPSPVAAQFEQAFSDPQPASGRQYESRAVIQAIPAAAASTRNGRTRVSAAPAAALPAVVSPVSAKGQKAAKCTHMVQLGSFASAEGAKRAYKLLVAQNPELRKTELTITPAVVKGRKFWRVAASGFDRKGAAGMCSSVKGRGGACFAYAAARPVPGALPGQRNGSAMNARR